jgi:hypothetical protein
MKILIFYVIFLITPKRTLILDTNIPSSQRNTHTYIYYTKGAKNRPMEAFLGKQISLTPEI